MAALPRKIRIAVILQVALAGALVALGAFLASSYVRDRVVVDALEMEADYYWQQRKLDPAHRAPQSRMMRAYAVDRGGSASLVPEVLRNLAPGVHELEDPGVVVLVDDKPEGRFYVTYPSARARQLTLAMIAAPVLLALLALALSGWLTYRVARRLVAPMGWLAGEVRNWDPRNPDVRGLAADRLPPDADAETRELAGALHAMAERVRAFVARERDFTRDASHELRTPLTVIRVASDLLLGDPDLPTRSQRSLSRIQRAGRDMEAVIDAFLILARESDVAPQSEDFEVRDVVHEEVERSRESPDCPKEGVALEAVQAAILVLEDSPRFNAGKGAVFDATGGHQLDASVMEGHTQRAGAVAGVTTVRHPVLLARAVMEHSPHVMLAGEGAERFADTRPEIERVPNAWFDTERRREQLEAARRRARAAAAGDAVPPQQYFGTVGAVALDRHGHIAAATSTGGMTDKQWNRIGDSPVIGAGTWADARCGVSGTGWGEFYLRAAVAHDICARVAYRGDSLAEAAEAVVNGIVPAMGGDGGAIALDARGNIAMPFNTPGMYRAWLNPDGSRGTAIWDNDR